MSELEARFGQGGEAFVEQLLLVNERVLTHRRGYGVEIGVLRHSELLIGDNPAATYDHGARLVGSLTYLTSADAVLRSLTPHHVLAADERNVFVDVPMAAAVQVNVIEMSRWSEACICARQWH